MCIRIRKGEFEMKLKKTLCAFLAGAMLLGTTALAKDNIYAYNKFVSTILGQQVGYCDFAASFAGHEDEYENINDYFSGLISAFYDDIDADFDNELAYQFIGFSRPALYSWAALISRLSQTTVIRMQTCLPFRQV